MNGTFGGEQAAVTIDKLTDALFLLRRFQPVTKMHVGRKVWEQMQMSMAPNHDIKQTKTTFLGVRVIIDHQHPYREPEFE